MEEEEEEEKLEEKAMVRSAPDGSDNYSNVYLSIVTFMSAIECGR